MKNGTLFFVMGVSGCGKSTIAKLLAEKFGIPYFDGDDYHPQENITKMKAGKALNDNDRQGWLEALNTLAIANKNKGAVIACSALKKSYRIILQQSIKAQSDFVFLDGSYDLIYNRLKARQNHFMPEELLRSQFETLEIPENAISVSIENSPEEIIAKIVAKYKSKKR